MVIKQGYLDVEQLKLSVFEASGKLVKVQGLHWDDILLLVPIKGNPSRWTAVLHRKHGYIAVNQSCNAMLREREEEWLDYSVFVKNNFAKMAKVHSLMPRLLDPGVFMLPIPPKRYNNTSWCRWDRDTMYGSIISNKEELSMMFYNGFLSVVFHIDEKAFSRRLSNAEKIEAVVSQLCMELRGTGKTKGTPVLDTFINTVGGDFASKFSGRVTRDLLGQALKEMRDSNMTVMPEFEDF
ncbi:hypothetical protein [Secundilactobacillus oryzae]|nr:hypothetical protein [Secundilactobacillus oryzae]